MGLSFSVKGENINFDLEDYEIIGYSFNFSSPNSKYAKGYADERSLKITGSLSRITDTKKDVLPTIRKWAKTEYKDDSYFNWIKVTETYRESLIREITFPNAFIKHYEEVIDPNTGEGQFVLTLLQQADKDNDIIIGPLNDSFIEQLELIKAKREQKVIPLSYIYPTESDIVSVTYIIEDHAIYELSTEKSQKFVIISDNDNDYGGDQTWFLTILNKSLWNDTGCGPVAATNILFYYAQNKSFGVFLFSNAYPTEKEFITWAALNYEVYTPQSLIIKDKNGNTQSFGVWFISTISDGMVFFAKRRNIVLTPHTFDNEASSWLSAANFIIKGLEKDYPVILFVTVNEYAASLQGITAQLHYVTITRMTEKRKFAITKYSSGKEEKTDLGIVDYSLTISTWGERNEIPSLKSLWESKTALSTVASIVLKTNVFLAYYEPVSYPVNDDLVNNDYLNG